jgi:hypothetical protein
VRVVLDNLNVHAIASLYVAFHPPRLGASPES